MQIGAGSQRGSHAGHYFDCNAGLAQGIYFLLRATEQHGIAAFQAHNSLIVPSRIDKPFVDEALRGRMASAAFADRDLLGLGRERHNLGMNQCVVKNYLGTLQQPSRAYGQQIRGPRTGTDQGNRRALNRQ